MTTELPHVLPTLEQALSAWAAMVRADREQVEALPDRPRPEDFYAPVAEQFRADPRRANEPVLEHLRSLITPGQTWLDLGAGGGRYTLAVALLAKRVYAVEPSAGMRAVLASGMAEHGISNIDVFDERWPGTSACPVAEMGLISHVAYDIEDVGPFLDQFEAHVSGRCVAVLFERAPISEFAPLWLPVHGEPRALLPGLPELVTLLLARARLPEVKLFESRRPSFASLDALHAAARRPLWVRAGSEADARLRDALGALAVKVEGGFALSAAPRYLGAVTWPSSR